MTFYKMSNSCWLFYKSYASNDGFGKTQFGRFLILKNFQNLE